MRVNLIPMAGEGSRFSKAGYDTPKPLVLVHGEPMVSRAISAMPKADRWIFIIRKEHLEFGLDGAIRSMVPDAEIVPIDHTTRGGLETCLFAEKKIKDEDSVFISACDIAPRTDMAAFEKTKSSGPDSIVLSFIGDPMVGKKPEAYSWVELAGDRVSGISLKKPISKTPFNDHAVVGSFWFRRWGDFRQIARSVLGLPSQSEYHLESVINGYVECGKKVSVFPVDKFICWGTPEELEDYLKTSPKLSIVVPCYNEAGNIPELLERFSEALAGEPGIELILVDNGSKDDTQNVINGLLPKYGFARTVKVEKNIGYGFGIMTGLKAAEGVALAFTHADLQCNPQDVLKAHAMLKGRALVKGNRTGRMNFLSQGLQAFASLVLMEKLDDINGQPKVFPSALLPFFRNPPNDFGLDLYIQHKAMREGFSVKSIPVVFGERKRGTSSWAGVVPKLKVIAGYVKTVLMLRFGLYN